MKPLKKELKYPPTICADCGDFIEVDSPFYRLHSNNVIYCLECADHLYNKRKISLNKPLTKEQLLARGQCCKLKCLNCPYVPKWGGGKKVK